MYSEIPELSTITSSEGDLIGPNNQTSSRVPQDTFATISLGPITTTTIVTTTTTTSYPPLYFQPPSYQSLDPQLYPLAHVPTPPALKNFTFNFKGHTTIFQEHSSFDSHNQQVNSSITVTKPEDFLVTATNKDLKRSAVVADNSTIEACQDTPIRENPRKKPKPSIHIETPPHTVSSRFQKEVYTPSGDSTYEPEEYEIPTSLASILNDPRQDGAWNEPASPALPSPLMQQRSLQRKVSLVNCNIGSKKEAISTSGLVDMLGSFDSLPHSLQSYMLFQMLRRCPTNTLQYVSSVIIPTLKRDFIGLLPFCLSLKIASFLDCKSMCKAAQVSKQWRKVIDSDPTTWKNLIERQGYIIDEEDEDFLSRFKERRCILSNDGKILHACKTEPLERRNEALPQLDNTSSIADHGYKQVFRRHHLIRRNWLEGKAQPLSFPGHGHSVVTCLQFDADKIVSGSEDQCINVYDIKTGELRKRLEGHDGGVWALQYVGNTLVSGSTDRTVRVWDMEEGVCTHIFYGHTSTVRCLQIIMPTNVNPDTSGPPIMEPPFPVVVTGSRDSTLRIWRLPSLTHDPPYLPSHSSSPINLSNANPYLINTLTGHTHSVRAIAGLGNLVVSGSYDTTVRVWNYMTGENIWRMVGHTQKVYSRCMSGSMDCTVRVWSLENGTCLHVLEGHSSLVGLLNLTPEYLVSAAADSTLRIWSPEDGTCLNVLSAHTGAITCFQHNADKVISGSDGTLKMWDIRTGKFVRDLLTGLSGVWQVQFDHRRCVAAVQKNASTWFEVLDFGVEGIDATAASTFTSTASHYPYKRALSLSILPWTIPDI
ncbi:WD40 repeat-like protein [Basidiobolus meristosporus CBS 931.73]|uniref:WD40 repeat-like protein n=1 Tax=Basidiobolus meristosporus CBS 931.73 TaxID=1314790 RepID=A0A1Y1YYZ4_9FUNG|nr:WD40 repeat-like protein [Basidiobolus meristosporus CBS 931.73]|eukprot:ORY02795.1 WD40 repeat-like protein [Basidiobolus meristosporus CBS 931.73]